MKRIISIIFIILLISSSSFANSDIKNWRQKTSDHFLIYYQDKNISEEFLEKVVNYAEDYYEKIANNLGFTRYDFWLWEKRAKIYIYRDQKSYMQDTGQPSWSTGAASYWDKIIRTYPLAAGFFDTLLPHELGHIIFREFVGFKNNIPLWLDEGVAAYQEEAKRYGSINEVKEALENNKLISLKELTKLDANSVKLIQDINLFYAESVSIVDFLISKFGQESFSGFCRNLKKGKTLEEAIREKYPYKNIDDLEWSWKNYLTNA